MRLSGFGPKVILYHGVSFIKAQNRWALTTRVPKHWFYILIIRVKKPRTERELVNEPLHK